MPQRTKKYLSRLTGKQEKFAQCVAEGMTYSDAYREAYNAKNSSNKTVNETSSLLMSNPKVAARVAEINKPIVENLMKKMEITKERLLEDLNRAKDLAEATDQASAMVGAVREQGKLLDLYPAKKRVNQNTTTITDMSPTERAARIAALLQKGADDA